ncbi:DUF1638 domain-containing protein [Curvivirga aplysinae]|uniref:DUF1638 domain-containing protein n=1 Tax=Curvivirga aplysinae TaxID=2529852 RepID=UPI0012BC0567|nr:DUF1638 domain-containing protein [Curvivirga aplysinae]MTI10416.1 DUF1638 domain-containing protein [Curvivirga aplysinae]
MSALPDNLKSPESEEAPEIFFENAKTLVIACGALAKEILTIIKLNDLTHISLTCLPANLHNRPDAIPERLEEKIVQYKDQYERILIGYADCGTGGKLDNICRRYNVERIQGAHCYAFFHGQDAFGKLADEELGTFYLTDYLVRQFDALIMEGMGLNKYPQMLELMFGNYKRVVYLAQTEDNKLLDMAQDAADKLKLELKIVKTGYGELADFISKGDYIHKQ